MKASSNAEIATTHTEDYGLVNTRLVVLPYAILVCVTMLKNAHKLKNVTVLCCL
jgi:hypothetical protein